MSKVKKSVAERTCHKRLYDIRVNKRQMQTQENKIDSGKALDADLVVTKSSGTELELQDESSRSVKDTDTDDADIRPMYDEEPMAKHYLPKGKESAFAKPNHMIASSSYRNSSKNMPRFSSNDMVHNHYIDEAKKRHKKEKGTQKLVKFVAERTRHQRQYDRRVNKRQTQTQESKIDTEYQLADLFTKALPVETFQYLVRRLGMRCLTPAELEALNIKVILFSIHSDDGNPSRVNIKQLCGRLNQKDSNYLVYSYRAVCFQTLCSETRPLMLEREAVWQRVERLMRGTVQNKVDRETHFNSEFDKFVVEPGEALVPVYNHFAKLMNDLERNGIIFPKVTVNTKFLNCLQPEWLNKKKLEKSHDPLALVAHTGSSSRTTSPYYITHSSLVVDYDDDYQGGVVQNTYEDPFTSAMILLAYAITQCVSNPTNNHLRSSSNTKDQAIVQVDRVQIQSMNSDYDGRNTRCLYVQEEVIEGTNVHNDAGNIQRTLQTMSLGTATNVQCYNCSEKGVILIDEQNDFLFVDASRMEEFKELSANICLMARIQPTNLDSDARSSYDYAFLSKIQTSSTKYVNPLFAKDKQEQKARRFEKESQSQFIDDRDIVRDLEQQCDKLELSVVELKRQTAELQKIQTILKSKMSENKDKYHDTVLDLEARAKKNADVVLKIGNSLQGMFMLGPKPMSVYG
uniref:Uncharacterized protein n=1 Tax=Tanacetum cinerariifolium TaxID=118510 RepID=A0A6L2KUF8_TANCI|nr:hypothetical protein [Tanacetum cinerariifolium]